MELALTADLHGFLPEAPECDVLVLAGDLCPATDHSLPRQAAWLDGPFRAWLEQSPAEAIVATPGNHDFIFERAPHLVPELPWTLLLDSCAVIDGVRFWGSPWTPWFHDWAFNAPRTDRADSFLTERYATCLGKTDVVVAHGPPAGFGDRTADGSRVGSQAARALIERVQPQLYVCGHIHEDRGSWQHGTTLVANVAAVDLEYRLRPAPFVRTQIPSG